ncbi:MAG TPA: hypothetical protein VGL13_12965, partial [Polyangiaceae bacterium]
MIRAHARLLMDGEKGALSEEQRRSLATIERQSHKLARLVDELEADTLAPVEAPKPERVSTEPPLEDSRFRILLADDDEGILEL